MRNPVSAEEYRIQREAASNECAAPTDMWFPSGQFCKSVACVNGEPGGMGEG